MFSLCRLCAKYTESTQLTTEILELSPKLKMCCGWKLSEDEIKMPQRVCDLCVNQLQQSWEFAENVWLAEERLRKLISERNPASEEPMPHTEEVITEIIKYEPDNYSIESDDMSETMEVTSFVESIMQSDGESSQQSNKKPKKHKRLNKKSNKKTIKTVNTTADSFLAALSDVDCLPDGTISADGVVKLEKMFPEMKTIMWNNCQYKCNICNKYINSPQTFFSHNRSIHMKEVQSMEFFCFYCNSKHGREYTLSQHIATDHFPHLKYR